MYKKHFSVIDMYNKIILKTNTVKSMYNNTVYTANSKPLPYTERKVLLNCTTI